MKITNQTIDYVMDAAIAGGISYWASSLDYGTKPTEPVTAMSEALTRGGTLTIEDDGETHEITKAKLRKGIEMALANTQMTLEDFDSTDADNAVQYALFGEIVYA